MQDARGPVRFERPPVIEVACGVAFTLPKALKSAHIGLYWSQIISEFPRCEDAPPIAMIHERQGPLGSEEISVPVEGGLMPMRRAWLINAEGTHLLQLQEDRFLYNWKRTGDSPYPSYPQVIAGFRREWARYRQFVESQNLGTPTPVQLELTYFNFWAGGPSWLRDMQREESPDRFLGPPELVNWKSAYALPASGGKLHIVAASARHSATNERGIRLDLTARGLPKDDTSEVGCERWFDVAHEWITQGFADITTSAAHTNWRRTA